MGRWWKLTVAAHGDGVGNTNGVELPAEHALFIDGSLDDLAELEHCGLRISWIASSFGDAQYSVDSLVTYNVCYNNPVSSDIPTKTKKLLVRAVSQHTCMDFPPTKHSQCRPAAPTSSFPCPALQHRTTWPNCSPLSAHAPISFRNLYMSVPVLQDSHGPL